MSLKGSLEIERAKEEPLSMKLLLDEITAVAGYATNDGYDVSSIIKAVENFNNDTTALRQACDKYYEQRKIKPEYIEICGYLSCIYQCIYEIEQILQINNRK